MKKSLFLFWATIGFVYFAGPTGVQAASRYQLDAVHSTVGFAVKHMLFSTVRGSSMMFEPLQTLMSKQEVSVQ